jgi:hypothetical protein
MISRHDMCAVPFPGCFERQTRDFHIDKCHGAIYIQLMKIVIYSGSHLDSRHHDMEIYSSRECTFHPRSYTSWLHANLTWRLRNTVETIGSLRTLRQGRTVKSGPLYQVFCCCFEWPSLILAKYLHAADLVSELTSAVPVV